MSFRVLALVVLLGVSLSGFASDQRSVHPDFRWDWQLVRIPE